MARARGWQRGTAAPRQLTFSTGSESNPAWSADSRRIAFAAKRDGQEESQIYVLDIAGGGEAERVTHVSTGASRPLWRPDGQAILFSSMIYPGALDEAGNRARIAERKARKYNARAYDDFPIRHWDRWLDERRPTLMLQPLAADAEAKDLLAGTELVRGRGFGGNLDDDGEILDAAWSPDGSTIVFTATAERDQAARAEVQQSLFMVPAGGGEPRRMTGTEAKYRNPQFAPDGSALYALSTPRTKFVYNDQRLVRFDWARPAPRPVAYDFRGSVDDYQVAADGERIYLLAEPGYVVLMTNYSGSTGYGEKFAQAIQGDPLAGPADEINQAADEAIRRYPFVDANRQAAGGASYGGHLANWLAVSTTRYRALVSHAGLYDLKTQWTTSDIAYSRERNLGGPPWEQRPVWRSTRLKTPILVTFGEKDFRVPYNNGLEFWTILKRQQIESRLVIFPDENHWILKGENSRYFYQEVQGWLAKHLAAP